MTITEGIRTENGSPVTLDETDILSLTDSFRGPLLRSGEPGYEDVRRVWNGMIDKRPALIARSIGTADVVAAVHFARHHDLLVAVRGGGHNVAGSAVCDGGVMIDLSLMKGIQVDPVKRTVRAQAGADWGDLNNETQLHGLVTPGGEVSTTGIAGYTLSGGIGQLHRKWGLACDNLLSVEIVTAEGEVLRASSTEHPDLFWAIRGGGGNFGIATWFEYQLHRLGPEVYSAGVIYPFEDAAALMRAWRSFTQEVPDEVTTEALFWSMPPLPDLPEELHGAPILLFGGLYAGPVDDGERIMRPLREFGTPILDLSGPAPYAFTQAAFDELFPNGLRYYWKSIFLDELSDELIDMIVERAAARPSAETLIAFRHMGGAISQVPEDATAYGNRRAAFNLSLDAIWESPGDDDRIVDWVRRAWSELRDRTGGGVYLNFAGLGEDNDVLARAGHGRNYERLQLVKRRYDPSNFFRGNINIRP